MGPSKGTALTIICLVAASLLVWTVTNHYASSPRLLAATYTTTPTRTDNVNKFCVGKDRTNYFS